MRSKPPRRKRERHGQSADATTGDDKGFGCFHECPRSSCQRPSFSCTGRSEKVKRTISLDASNVRQTQDGTTQTSLGVSTNSSPPMVARPSPSTTEKTVLSVER